MYYSEEEARDLVIKAGLRLIDEGLIARTWGNISARISEDEFIITPSGLAYETLKPSDLVKVKAKDLSYEGSIKPSSEKGIHAIAYVLRPEVSFIIHTHQFYASVIGLDGKDRTFAANTAYGLPGTDKLKENCMKSISNHPKMKAFFLQRHGVLCLGDDYEDAFLVSESMELSSKTLFEELMNAVIGQVDYFEFARKNSKTLKAYIDDFAQILGPSVDLRKSKDEICSGEDAEAEKMILDKNCAAMLYARIVSVKPLGFIDANLQRIVYVNKYSKLKSKN